MESRKKFSISHIGHRPTSETKVRMQEARYNGFWYGNVRYYEGPQYCEKWTKDLRERVRAYFGHKCFLCGQPQNGTALHVHHVWYNKRACCDDTPRSLVPLCIKCHNETTFGDKKYFSNYIQELLDLYYDGKCWLTREEYAALFSVIH